MSTEALAGPLASPELSVKLFVEDPAAVRLHELAAVFHRWIKEDPLEDELLIDVASYEHVPKGPGVVLICEKAHYYFDVRDGRPGIRYRGRREPRGIGEEGVVRAFRSALAAAWLLESDAALDGRYRFVTGEVEFGIYDRLLAPSEEQTAARVRPVLATCVKALYGVDDAAIEMVSGPREPFRMSVKTTVSPRVRELLGRLAVPSA